MKIKEIRDLTRDELASRKRELREESFHLRIQQQSGQLEKPSTLRAIRREIARVETVLTEKTKATASK
jgi:large subunit ribosomal protein L29